MEKAESLKNEGNIAFREKRYSEAIDLYSQAIEIDPSNHVYYSNRSGSYAGLGDYEASLNDAQKALDIKPDYAMGYSRKGHALSELGRTEDAIACYDEGLEKFPGDAKILSGKESLLNPNPNPMGGAPGGNMNMMLLQKLLSNPKTMGLLQKPGFMQKLQDVMTNPANFMKYQNDPDVQTILEAFSADVPKDFDPMSFANAQGGNQENEEEDKNMTQEEPVFQEAPKPTAPKKTVPKKSEGVIEKEKGAECYKNKDIEGALTHFKNAVELEPLNLLFRSNLIACHIELKQYAQGLADCEEALKIYTEAEYSDRVPEHLSKIYARWARILELQGDIDGAIEYYEKGILEFPDPKAKLALKECQKHKKQQEEMAYINPEIAEEERQAGNALFKEGKFVDALKRYEEALKRSPNDPKILNNQATTYVKLMEFNLAMSTIEKCLKIDPTNEKALLRKANIHFFLKEYHKAIDIYTSILKKDPTNAEAKSGLEKTQRQVSASMNDQNDEERLRRAMADPEIQSIVQDPSIKIALGQMQERPETAQAYFNDANMGPKLQKLITAGILKLG